MSAASWLFPTRLEFPVPRGVERGDQPEVEAEVVVVGGLVDPNRGYQIGGFSLECWDTEMLERASSICGFSSAYLLIVMVLLDMYYLYDR